MNARLNTRRQFLGGAALAGIAGVAACGLTLPRAAAAQPSGYPVKPVRLALPLGPGSANDTVGRLLAANLSTRLKQPVVVENYAGGGGTIGTGIVAKAAADGYTIGFGTLSTLVANAALYQKLSFDIERDVVPVALVTRAPLLLLSSSKLSAGNLRELIRHAKSHPGEITYASAGIGSINHVVTESMLEKAGIRMLHVPYKSNGQALIALASGEVDLLFDTAVSVRAMAGKGLVNLLAAGGDQRLPAFPDTPGFAESGVPGFDPSTWTAVIAPRGTPVAISDFIRQEVNAVLDLPEVRASIENTGSEVLRFPSAEGTTSFVASERARWVPIIRSLKIDLVG